MKSIVIGFSKPVNRFMPVFSWLVRLYLRKPYSHVYLKFYSDSLDRWIVYESMGSGVRFVGLAMWEKTAKSLKEVTLDISEEDYRKLLTFCVDNSGKPYDYLQNIGIFISNLLNLKKNILKARSYYTNCSEEIAIVLQKLGKTFDKDLDLVTPKDIEETLSN